MSRIAGSLRTTVMRAVFLGAATFAALATFACDSHNATGANAHPGIVPLALSTNVVAGAGAVLEAIATYTPPGTTDRVTIGRDSVLITAGGADAALSLRADVASCVRDFATTGASCIVQLTVRLTRGGVVLDESLQQLTVGENTERLDATPVQLFEVSTVRVTPAAFAGFEPGDSVALTATALDKSGATVTARTVTWSVLSGGIAIGTTGVMRALSPGAAQLRATVGGRTQDVALTVSPSSVATIDLAPADTTLSRLSSFTYRATARSASGAALPGRALAFQSSATGVVTVSATTGVANAVGVGSAIITARSTEGRNGSVVTATATIRADLEPIVTIEPSTLSFTTELGQALPPAQTVTVRNSGGGSLNTIFPFVPADSLVSTTLDRSTAPATLTVRPTLAATSTLPPGVPTQTVVRIRSTTPNVPDGLLTITITRRPSPQIVVDRQTVSFDSVPPSTISAPTNVSVTSPTRVLKSLQASVAYLQSVSPWLTATLTPTTTPGTLTLRAAAGSLAPGTYSADVTITSVDPHTPTTVRVTMRVPAGPSVVLAPRTLSFGPLDPALIFGTAANVSVTSTIGVLNTVSTNTIYINGSGWLTTSLLASNTPTSLQITPRPTGLAEGTYQARVVVASATPGTGADTVNAQLVVRKDSIVFVGDSVIATAATGAAALEQLVNVRARSGDTLRLDTQVASITYDQAQFTGWILSTPVSAAVLPATLRFTPNAANLPQGTYSAKITLRARGGTRIGVLKVIFNVSGFSAFSLGGSHSCALNSLSVLYCWGDNAYGQLGTGNVSSSLVPVRSVSAPTFAQLAVTENTSCGRTTAGAVYCWGSNYYGLFGNGTIDPSGLLAYTTPTIVSGGLAFTDLKLSMQHACGLVASGAAYCWGDNSYGELGNNTLGTALTPTPVFGGIVFAQIAVGDVHTCGRTAAGLVYCWGYNGYGALGNGTVIDEKAPKLVSGAPAFVDIVAGGGNTCGRTASGTAYCWGANYAGQVGIGFITSEEMVPTPVKGGLSFAELSIGTMHVCGRTSAGALYCWGDNESYELGTGSLVNTYAPSQVVLGPIATSVRAGSFHACARVTTGALYCWGNNTSGQIGNGLTQTPTTPQAVLAPSSFVTSAVRAALTGMNAVMAAPRAPARASVKSRRVPPASRR